jgi:hypothetical protein
MIFFTILIPMIFWGILILVILGQGLVELTIEFFTSPPPGMGIVYRDTDMSNRITRAILSDEAPRIIRTRPRPVPEPGPETDNHLITISPGQDDKFR